MKENNIDNKNERIPRSVMKKQIKYIIFLHANEPVQVQIPVMIRRTVKNMIAAAIT